MAKTETLKGTMRASAELLDDDEVEALLAKKEKARRRRADRATPVETKKDDTA